MRPVTEYQLVDHFRSQSSPHIEFTDAAFGVGPSPAEAIESALAKLAAKGWDVNGLGVRILNDNEWASTPREAGSTKSFSYVSVRVR
jgi:hypothetical protein